MPKGPRRRTGNFAGRPLALRRELLAVLDRADKLTARELAASVYSGRVCLCRPQACSRSQLASTRKALCRLIDKGRVVVAGHHRRRQLFSLTGRDPFPPLDLGSLDG
ncbi:hypothetical protein SAMN05216330_102435 [Bradyrhizobium sp. Ghvi]|uniref:hypothetical protein n=1 Tax=Bradyrhizobium sp. Ghvi TaxID=1855319 RepID=UPI0008E25DC7|nr:hypothetical protein [Bradyrhizobium sp. Ghvi]SFO25770.1 hypothetical protein SAMN05216330_102435 [Bradyrhizobium sp. Ghvi]